MLPDKKINVLIVDDSLFMRRVVSEIINSHEKLNVIGLAENGKIALEKFKALNPDVVVLDVEMPVMNGLETLEAINNIKPTPVIMLSSLTKSGAEVTIKALELGLSDFITKPDNEGHTWDSVKKELITKVLAAKVNIKKDVVETPFLNTALINKLKPIKEKVVVIGSSTGGPNALKEVVPYLPSSLPAKILIVQHMPPNFTGFLAQRLDNISQISVNEAKDGDYLKCSQALVAPGNFHMTIDENYKISLNQDAPVRNVRPSIDVTLFSASKAFKQDVISVILTGMGCDGKDGTAVVKENNGYSIAEDESTTLIYGMPKCVIEAGLADSALPLNKIANAIVEAVYR